MLVVAVLVIGALIVASWVLLGFKQYPTYPPPDDALSPAASRAVAERLATAEQVGTADLAVNLAPSTVATFELHIDGTSFFPRILADIDAATSSVHVNEYGIRPGQVSDTFRASLKEKARQGLDVRLIVDRFGSSVDWESKALFDDLVAAGVQVVQNDAALLDRDGLLGSDRWIDWRFDELAHLDHRKMFVIDGRIGWVGGAGLEDHFANGTFHDVFVRIEGDAVGHLQTVFLISFRFLGGQLPSDSSAFDRFYPPPAEPGKIRTTVLLNVPQEGHLANTDAIQHLIEHAQSRLDVIGPYTADRATLERLMVAARRGVHVRFVAPAESNNWPTAGALEHYFEPLAEAGVQVWLHPVLPHAKVVLADDRVLVGTTNLDAWALYRNWEIGLLFEDAAVAETFRQNLFEEDVAESRPATPPTNPLIRARDWLLALISPLL